MTFAEYQAFTKKLAVYNADISAHIQVMSEKNTVIYHEEPLHFLYPVLALAEEAGEVAGKVAKYIRKSDTDYQTLRKGVKLELGDVLYQLSEAARQFGYTLDEIAEGNVAKLTDRKDRGVLVGEGDNR